MLYLDYESLSVVQGNWMENKDSLALLAQLERYVKPKPDPENKTTSKQNNCIFRLAERPAENENESTHPLQFLFFFGQRKKAVLQLLEFSALLCHLALEWEKVIIIETNLLKTLTLG